MFKILRHCCLAVLLLSASIGAYSESRYDLEILQPRAGLDTNNRFYRAYPGIEYNVGAAVIGGAFPYSYSLAEAPAGMSINQSTGEISWPSPTVQATPYPVTLSVSDSNGQTQQVSWQITVTTDKFLFVDAINGKSGASGTIDDPVKTFADVYGGTSYSAKNSTELKNYFVYFRGSTDGSSNYVYPIDGYGDGPRIEWTSNQPVVLMAYPGEHPVVDAENAHVYGLGSLSNLYVEGLDVTPISNTSQDPFYHFAFRVTGSSSNVTFRNNRFTNLAVSSGSNNQSAIMITRENRAGSHWAIINNEFAYLENAYGVIGYTASRVLIANNAFHHIEGGSWSHALGPKEATQYWFIRANQFWSNSRDNILLLYGYNDDSASGNIEVSYNLVEGPSDSSKALYVNSIGANNGGPVYIFRNTIVRGRVLINKVQGLETATLEDNVIVNNTNGIECNNCTSTSNLVDHNNIKGSTSAGITEVGGVLTGSYEQYIGQIGHQFMARPIKPAINSIRVGGEELLSTVD